jgi:hypothetical protein
MEADKNKPHLSRAAAAAHRRLSASEARRISADMVTSWTITCSP